MRPKSVTRLAWREPKIWVGFVLILAAVFYLVFLLLPMKRQLKQTLLELESLHQKLKGSYFALLKAPSLGEGVLLLHQEVDTLRNRIPQEERVDEIIRLLSQEAQARKIRVISITPQASFLLSTRSNQMIESENWTCYILPVTLSLEGSYRNIGEFIEGLSELPRLATLQKLTLRRDETISPILHANCQVAAYYLVARPKP